MKNVLLAVLVFGFATSAMANPRVDRLERKVNRLERQLDRLRDRVGNQSGRGGVSCNWNGQRWLSKGFDGGQAWTIGAYVTCNGRQVTNISYNGN